MKKSTIRVMSLICLILISGCASIKDAPVSSKTETIDVSNESLAFMTLKVSNQKNTAYQPNIIYSFIWEDKPQNAKKYSFKVDKPLAKSDKKYNEYVISFQVKPGKYVLREILGQSGVFPVIGTFSVPMFKDVEVPANKVVYLGHIDATVVDRTSDDQLRAGPVIPLIDQAVVGASGGTFKIDIQDNYAADISTVKSKYPAFNNVKIENMTLSQWEKPSESKMK